MRAHPGRGRGAPAIVAMAMAIKKKAPRRAPIVAMAMAIKKRRPVGRPLWLWLPYVAINMAKMRVFSFDRSPTIGL